MDRSGAGLGRNDRENGGVTEIAGSFATVSTMAGCVEESVTACIAVCVARGQ